MKISFYLRKEQLNRKGKASVSMVISGNGIYFRKIVKGVNTSVADWGEKKERLLPNKKKNEYNYHVEFNKKLDEIELKIKELFRHLHLNNLVLTKESIVGKLQSNELEKPSLDFFESFDYFIETNKPVKAKRTVMGYATAKNFLKEFVSETGFVIGLESLNLDFFDSFRNYAFEKRETKNNYFAKLIATIKTFMKWTADRGIHNNYEFLKFVAKEEDIEVISLTKEELYRLYNMEFKSDRLSHVRDVFCFGCFTSLRYSDIKSLMDSNIQGEELVLSLKKTKTISHKIPLGKPALHILEKYRGTVYSPLPTISEPRFNEYIKECCELVEINTMTTITRYVGTKQIVKTVPKYELITSHVARKTFITIMLLSGATEVVVRKISGHANGRSFNKYVNVTDSDKKLELDKVWKQIEQ